MKLLYKDRVMNDMAENGLNVGQFVSYGPDGAQRYVRVCGVSPAHSFGCMEDALKMLFAKGAKYINIRSFMPEKPDGHPFILGQKLKLDTPEKLTAKARELIAMGLHVIFNENINPADGGVSGVMQGDVVEFSLNDTPRCVDKPEVLRMSRWEAERFFLIVYGMSITLPYTEQYRVEFSIHPHGVGYFNQRYVFWQVEKREGVEHCTAGTPYWPNRVSRDVGDKAYGLLMAHMYGFPVPKTRVFGRLISFFEFGEDIRKGEYWVRTAPRTQEPGLFTTIRGNIDPFALMAREDPDGTRISSILVQDDVTASFSGATLTSATGAPEIQGKSGSGDSFMVGASAPELLPEYVQDAVARRWKQLCAVFGPVRFEWCYAGGVVWVMQLHVGQSVSHGDVIYPGEPERFEVFYVHQGLDYLRAVITHAQQEGFGIILKGNVGITSHFGDVLRRGKVPSRLERS